MPLTVLLQPFKQKNKAMQARQKQIYSNLSILILERHLNFLQVNNNETTQINESGSGAFTDNFKQTQQNVLVSLLITLNMLLFYIEKIG